MYVKYVYELYVYPVRNKKKRCQKFSDHSVKCKLHVCVTVYGRISVIFFLKLEKCPNLAMTLTKLVYDDHGQNYV